MFAGHHHGQLVSLCISEALLAMLTLSRRQHWPTGPLPPRRVFGCSQTCELAAPLLLPAGYKPLVNQEDMKYTPLKPGAQVKPGLGTGVGAIAESCWSSLSLVSAAHQLCSSAWPVRISRQHATEPLATLVTGASHQCKHPSLLPRPLPLIVCRL